jgi:hypothetical protein
MLQFEYEWGRNGNRKQFHEGILGSPKRNRVDTAAAGKEMDCYLLSIKGMICLIPLFFRS